MAEPIDIESLPPLYREVFLAPENGMPDNISKDGCLALANLGKVAWNTWRARFPRGGCADFSALQFSARINFSGFNFGEACSFLGAKFTSKANFSSATFGPFANFDAAIFEYGANFDNAQFERQALFRGTQFGYDSTFKQAKFGIPKDSCSALFTGVQFTNVTFLDTIFSGYADFSGGTWEKVYKNGGRDRYLNDAKAYGIKVEISPYSFGNVIFTGAQFMWRSNFQNRDFLCEGDFSHACFSVAPEFFNSKLSENVFFDAAQYPDASGNLVAIRAYRTLKLAFSKQQAIREEQRFFKLEMAEEAKAALWYKKPLYATYWAFSEYGFSVARPLIMLLSTFSFFAAIYGTLAGLSPCLPFQSACTVDFDWVQFSVVQSIPLPGLEKLNSDLDFPVVHSIGFTVAAILHKTISLLALFLMGLALRNLFKLK